MASRLSSPMPPSGSSAKSPLLPLLALGGAAALVVAALIFVQRGSAPTTPSTRHAAAEAALSDPMNRESPPTSTSTPPSASDWDALLPIKGWTPEIRTRLIAALDKHVPQPGQPAPAAVFDCDNTLIYGDIGDATLVTQATYGPLKGLDAALAATVPPPADAEALLAEWETQRGFLATAQPAAIPRSLEFAARLFASYDALNRAHGGSVAYTFAARLLAGLTPTEAQALAERALTLHAASWPPPATGEVENPSAYVGLRPYPEMIDLVRALSTKGFVVYIVSASNVYSVRAVAPLFGVPPERVFGMVPQVDGEGRLTAQLASPIPYRAGKAEIVAALPHKAVFVAGDAETDLEMMRLAPTALLIDRNKPTMLAEAAQRGWIVHPRFLASIGVR